MIPNVMCIEDDTTTLMLFEFLFKDENFCQNFIPVENGQLAFDYFETYMKNKADQKIIPNLIFLDLNMPVMGGWEFLETMENIFPDLLTQLNIIVLSSSVNPKDQDLAKENKFVMDFLDKPLVKDQLNALKQKAVFKDYFS